AATRWIRASRIVAWSGDFTGSVQRPQPVESRSRRGAVKPWPAGKPAAGSKARPTRLRDFHRIWRPAPGHVHSVESELPAATRPHRGGSHEQCTSQKLRCFHAVHIYSYQWFGSDFLKSRTSVRVRRPLPRGRGPLTDLRPPRLSSKIC